jgi:nucleoside-diphosphate-sugar epimerase
MSEITGDDIESRLVWHPDTDYLGNHRLSATKVQSATGWDPVITLTSGIREVWREAAGLTHNPLHHLEEAKRKGVDLLSHF